MSDYLDRTSNATFFTGSDIDIYRAIVCASALELYAKAKLRAHRNLTPSRMLRLASEMTGQTFKRGRYREAAAALREMADKAKHAPRLDKRCGKCDCADPTALPGLARECECSCH